jgi:hypothetical protein
MARVGTEGYAEDLLLAASKLKTLLGQTVEVVPLPHMFMAGCTCPMTIRTAAEVTAWADKVYGEGGRLLSSSFRMANHLLSPRTGEIGQADYERLLRLPKEANWPSGKISWAMSGFDLPMAIQPTSEDAEKEIITCLINELRTGLALDLDPAPSFDRKMPAEGRSGQTAYKDYIVTGRAKASAMVADALVRAGKTLEQVVYPEWRVTQPFVAKMATDLATAMAKFRPRVIIIAGLDESYYMAQYEEFHTSPARKDAEGIYHIDGDLVMAAKEAQLKILKLLEPIWELTAGIRTIVIGPMARYITESCCDDPDHIPNRQAAGFMDGQKKELLAARNVLKDYFQNEKHNHCRVLDPAVDIAGKKAEEVWGKGDPTHPRPEIYDGMVAALGKAESRIDLLAKRPGAAIPAPPPKRAKTAIGSGGRDTAGGGRGSSGSSRGGGGGRGGGQEGRGGGQRGRGNLRGGRGRGWRRDDRWYGGQQDGGQYGGQGGQYGGGGQQYRGGHQRGGPQQGAGGYRGRRDSRFWAPAYTGGGVNRDFRF